MQDGLSLDQVRTFIAAADLGSFSAAGRKLGRAQSAVSQTIAKLEAQIGVPLFDRAARYPTLTAQGRILLADARTVASAVDALKSRAKGMSSGLEAELSVAVDVMFPLPVLTASLAAFKEAFPVTPLRIYVEALGGVAQAVLDRRCDIGVVGSLPLDTPELVRDRLLGVKMVFVAAPGLPLAGLDGPASDEMLARHTQLVLTDRTDLSRGHDFAVRSPQNWRLADLGAKHAFLLAGLGWGGMPLSAVGQDLAAGRLVELALEAQPTDGFLMQMSATYRADRPPGPAGRWLLEALKTAPPCPDDHPI